MVVLAINEDGYYLDGHQNNYHSGGCLSLCGSDITEVCGKVPTDITALSLRDNKIVSLDYLEFHDGVTYLNASNNRLRHISFKLPRELNALVLSFNYISSFDSVLPDGLERVDLYRNSITDLLGSWHDVRTRKELLTYQELIFLQRKPKKSA